MEIDAINDSINLVDHAAEDENAQIVQSLLSRVSSKRKESLHHMAYVYYQNQRYSEADAAFRLLVMLEPENFHFWKGLGACLQMKKNYDAAINCYDHALSLLQDKVDTYIYIHLSDCYFALKRNDLAFTQLELAKKEAKKVF